MPQKSLGRQKPQNRKEHQNKRLLGGNSFAYVAVLDCGPKRPECRDRVCCAQGALHRANGYQLGDEMKTKAL
jgi:hypothetical protein